jgi:hypothetical protein
MLFGMTESSAKGKLTRRLSFIDKDIASKFAGHPMIKELSDAMTAKRNSIELDEFYIDAFDRKIAYEGNSKSSLALLMQSYESLIMSSIYDLDFQDREGDYKFTVVAHLHDGVYFKFKNEQHRHSMTKQINDTIDTRLNELGIPSKLEWEYIDDAKVKLELESKELEFKIKQQSLNSQDYDEIYTPVDDIPTSPPLLPLLPLPQEIMTQQQRDFKPKFCADKYTFIYDPHTEWEVIEQHIENNTLYCTVKSCWSSKPVSHHC